MRYYNSICWILILGFIYTLLILDGDFLCIFNSFTGHIAIQTRRRQNSWTFETSVMGWMRFWSRTNSTFDWFLRLSNIHTIDWMLLNELVLWHVLIILIISYWWHTSVIYFFSLSLAVSTLRSHCLLIIVFLDPILTWIDLSLYLFFSRVVLGIRPVIWLLNICGNMLWLPIVWIFNLCDHPMSLTRLRLIKMLILSRPTLCFYLTDRCDTSVRLNVVYSISLRRMPILL